MEKQLRDNLNRIRREMNLTQKEMAEKLGMSRVAYANIETGKTRLISDKVERFVERNDVSPAEMVLGYKISEDDVHTLQQAQADYGRRRQEIVDAYEERISALNAEIDSLKQQVADLRDSIDTKNDIINLLRRQIEGR
ncbi:MAG: helix-turn-helix domain-containing protein [Bacteroidales bacterium]|nr:helix-turn-helix domain-containing protein [Bacteroidales bacterium]